MLAAGFIALGFANAVAQSKRLTYAQVFRRGEPRLTQPLPRITGWLDDRHYLVNKRMDAEEGPGTVLLKVNAKTGRERVFLDFQEYVDALPEGFRLREYSERTEDWRTFLFSREADLYIFSLDSREFRRLTENAAEENNPRFSPDGSTIAFTREHDLYVADEKSGVEQRLTTDGSETVYNGWASWVYYEEILGRRSRYRAFWWSPDSKMLAFLRFDDSRVPVFNITGADGVHGELEVQRYPKPGDPNPGVRLGIVHIDTGEIVWVDVEGDDDQYVAWPFWTPDSRQLFFQWMNRGQDRIILYAADPKTGEKRMIVDESQTAWVDFFTDLHFFEDGRGFILRSDRDGWSHLYTYDLDGRMIRQVTRGDWSVRNIGRVDEKNNRIFFEASPDRSVENHLYCIDLSGGDPVRLTENPGWHRCDVSQEGQYFIDDYSSIDHPTIRELWTTQPKRIRILGDSKLPLMDSYAMGKVETFTIPTDDGVDLPAVWVLPPDFDSSKKYPVIFSIYSGPGSTDARNAFGGLRDHFFAQNGIITVAVDHRGSSHFGKRGMAMMHRNLGKWEMQDLTAAAEWLCAKPYIDAERIGITGGSYGGYTTLMALCYGKDVFTHGIAGSSVADWRLYDTVYTERYMDTPEENPEGYEFGSVLTHAAGLKGKLLITHGTMDDNVHMQNIIQLIDKLEDLNKDFALMLYPGQRHGIRGLKRNHSTRESVQFWFRHFLGRELSVEEIGGRADSERRRRR